MKLIVATLVMGTAAICAAQPGESPTLEELEAERDQLRRELEAKEAQIDDLAGPRSAAEDQEMREWQRELEQELDEIGKFLDEVPRELTTYYVSMQKALGEMLEAIEQGFDETREAAHEKIAAAERRYWGTHETVDSQSLLHELRTRAEELGATQEAASLIESFEKSLQVAEQARANALAAEAELDRAQKQAEIAGRKLEVKLMEIETRRMEESLNKQGS